MKDTESIVELVYSIDSDNITAKQAAEYFAETYWEKPRKIATMLNNQFTLEDGTHLYEVQFKIGIRFKTWDTWEIWRISKIE